MSGAAEKNRIAVIIPSFNEGERVVKVVSQVLASGYSNVIVIDDCSEDQSMESLKDMGVVILHHLVNRGAGAATETGLEYCRHLPAIDAVVTIDADTQHDPADIDRLVEEHFNRGADITVGNRFLETRNEIPGVVRFFNHLANITTMVLSGRKVGDSQSGFKVIGKRALELIRFEHDNYEYCSELFVKARKHKLRIVDVPVKVYYPEELKNKGQNLFSGISTFFNLIYSTLFKHH